MFFSFYEGLGVFVKKGYLDIELIALMWATRARVTVIISDIPTTREGPSVNSVVYILDKVHGFGFSDIELNQFILRGIYGIDNSY